MKGTTAKNLIKIFSNHFLCPIFGQCTYEHTVKIFLKLDNSTASIHSNRGTSQLRVLSLHWNLKSVSQFLPQHFHNPASLGQDSEMSKISACPQITHARKDCQEAHEEFKYPAKK